MEGVVGDQAHSCWLMVPGRAERCYSLCVIRDV